MGNFKYDCVAATLVVLSSSAFSFASSIKTTLALDEFSVTEISYLNETDTTNSDIENTTENLQLPLEPDIIDELSIRYLNKTAYYVGRAACECGRKGDRRLPKSASDFDRPIWAPKIVNGEPARIDEYPWTVALLGKTKAGVLSKTGYCGGSLINNYFVVTAAHCVYGMNDITVVLHEETFSLDNETPVGAVRIPVDKIIMHSDYQRNTYNNDIALLKLSRPVPLGRIFVPVCLPANNGYSFEGEEAIAVGWGATREGGRVSDTLQKVKIPILKNWDCNTKTIYSGRVSENMLCAGRLEGGKDSCQGDSGGPLVLVNGGRKLLVGIVSWGLGCAREKSPGVYTRVGRYPQWIVSNTAKTKGVEWCLG